MMKENDIHGGLTDLELEKEMLDGELIIKLLAQISKKR